MKKLYDVFVPKFLRDFDLYLLRNYPVVWRTKAVFVLFYGLVGAVLLFAAGFFYPVDAQHLTVEPKIPIELGYDTYHLWTVFFTCLPILYWAHEQYLLGFPFTKVKDTLLTLLIYAFCFLFLFGITTPAFRWGTIYKTAYHWIKEEDLNHLKKSGIYPYGIVFFQQDTAYERPFTDSFFLRREGIFKEIHNVEDSLFEQVYTKDTVFWVNWFLRHHLDYELDLYRSHLLEQSYLTYLSHRLSSFDFLYLSEESHKSYQKYLPYVSYQLHLSGVPYKPQMSDYNQYKIKTIQAFENQFNQYQFINIQDFIQVEVNNRIIEPPTLPYYVENTIHSVKNAQLYWQSNFFMRNAQLLLSYILGLSLLFYFIPFLSLRHFLIAIILSTLSAIIVASHVSERQPESINRDIINAAYLIIPTLSSLYLLLSAFRKQQFSDFILSIQGLFSGLLVVMTGALFIIWRVKFEFYQINSFQPPYNLAFYGIQVLGILGAVLTTYVRTLPKG